MIIYCLSYAHDIMIWITRSSDLHSDNIITTTTTTTTTTAILSNLVTIAVVSRHLANELEVYV